MATKMDPVLAKSLIQEFRTQNKASGEHALKTPDGQHLHGFFVDRESLENILKDQKVAGIHVHLAKHPDFTGNPSNVHTIVYSGSTPDTTPGAATPFVSTGEVYGNTEPCPPWCSK